MLTTICVLFALMAISAAAWFGLACTAPTIEAETPEELAARHRIEQGLPR